jgi:hypothetical protein
VTGTPAEQAPTRVVGALPPASPSLSALASANSELESAIRIARRMLDRYGTVDSGSVYAYTVAHGGLVESLRLLLRALDAEPDGEASSKLGEASARCPAAHPQDPTGCNGPVVVTVLDKHNAGANGCEHHGARLLASLDGGRVYPLPDAPEAAALRVFHAADTIRPFPWMNGPRTRPEHLSRAENRERGESR